MYSSEQITSADAEVEQELDDDVDASGTGEADEAMEEEPDRYCESPSRFHTSLASS